MEPTVTLTLYAAAQLLAGAVAYGRLSAKVENIEEQLREIRAALKPNGRHRRR